jgi:hypothetical protein
MSHGQSDLKVTYLVFRLMKNIIFNKGNANMLILECSQGCYTVKFDPVTLKINRVPDSLKD